MHRSNLAKLPAGSSTLEPVRTSLETVWFSTGLRAIASAVERLSLGLDDGSTQGDLVVICQL